MTKTIRPHHAADSLKPPRKCGMVMIRQNAIRYFVLIMAAVAVAATPMFSRPTLWQVVRQLGNQAPFTKEKLEAQLGVPLARKSQNDFFTFFEGGPVKLANGVVIGKIDLRLRHDGQAHPGFLVLTLAGQCVTVPELRQHYNHLSLLDVPRGRSVNEVTSAEATEPWGTISFALPVTNPTCISTIAFKPTP
ncbi:hypothetical protein FAES_2879 [Fibrella aestuarina BUZ 2]|uniref:Uncharacterized protein n=2 Tax=Fibrella TaxID=861914 RepID=I0K9T5_9BACT|nr:hypothetical protein FAES_2879 [Fibrella aestuarina BUZ 2]